MQKGKKMQCMVQKNCNLSLHCVYIFTSLNIQKFGFFFHPATVKCDKWTEGQKDRRQKWQTLYDQAIIHMAEDKKNIKEIKW